MEPLDLAAVLRLAAAYYRWRAAALAWLTAHERPELPSAAGPPRAGRAGNPTGKA
jgi:hypothetical protein